MPVKGRLVEKAMANNSGLRENFGFDVKIMPLVCANGGVRHFRQKSECDFRK